MSWFDIPGYEDYCISTDKQVKSKRSGRILKEYTYTDKNISQVQLITYPGERKRSQRKLVPIDIEKLYEITFPFYWFNQLADDEMVKPLVFDGIPEGLYYITSYGRVWSTASHRFMEKNNHIDYYNRVGLTHKGFNRQAVIHRCVGRAFLPDYKPGLFILHKDETLPMEEIDNVNNLWCGTHQENLDDMKSKGRSHHNEGRILTRCPITNRFIKAVG